MSTGSRFLLSVVAITVIAIVAVVIAMQRGAPIDPTQVPNRGDATATEAGAEPVEVPALPVAVDPSSTRHPIEAGNDADGAVQGFRGRLVDVTATPIEGAIVYLVEGHASDPFATMLRQRLVVAPPVAKAVSDRSGSFELRVRSVASGGYEIHAISDRHADAAMPNLTMFAQRVIDVGDLIMPTGLVVQGRITVQGSNGFPVPDALVSIQSADVQSTLAAAPGREDGIEVRADAAGAYVVPNVRAGLVKVTAVAPGFARVTRQNVDVRVGLENRVDFELPRGMSIAGIATDLAGRPIAGARVGATLISVRDPALSTARSDADGRFEILGLIEGPYELAAEAAGYVRTVRKPIRAGARDERIELPAQGSAWIRVSDAAGRTLSRFDLLLRAFHTEQDALGRVPSAQLERVLPPDLEDGWFQLHNLDPATHDYVIQVDADGYARTFSAPFRIKVGADAPRIEVRMSGGGVLRGRAVTEDGRPLGDVVITTLPNFLDDSPFAALIGGMVPNRITETRARSAADGRFEIPLLAAGMYQIRVEHDGYCATAVKDIAVEAGAVAAIPDVVMPRGTSLVGTVTVDGAPAGQVKVAIASAVDPEHPTAPGIRAEAISDDQGRFSLSRRLPPGRYVAQAARQSLPNPILLVVDYQKTRQEFVIAHGQINQELHFTLTSD